MVSTGRRVIVVVGMGALLAWALASRGEAAPRRVGRPWVAGSAQAPSELSVGAVRAPREAVVEDAVPAVTEPPKSTTPAPQSPTSSLPPPKTTEVRLRLERGLPDGTSVPIEISEVQVEGDASWRVLPADAPCAVAPGWTVTLQTADRAVALPSVRFEVPDPVPAELTARIPSADDPSIQAVEIVVVDAVTGRALPDAVLEFEDADLAPLRADGDGRMRLESRQSLPGLAGTALHRWLVGNSTLHAPGYFARARPASVRGSGETASAPELAVLKTGGGVTHVRAELVPLPHGTTTRRLRLLHADGRPAAGLLVVVLRPNFQRDGVRRVPASGEIAFPMEAVIGLDVRWDGFPLVSFDLLAERWPAGEARSLRLPPLADVEIEIHDAPDTEGAWADEGSHMCIFEPLHMPEFDPGVHEHEHWPSLFTGQDYVRGSAAARRATIRFTIPAAAKRTLHVQYADERRGLDVAPTAPGPLRIHARWADLPLLR